MNRASRLLATMTVIETYAVMVLLFAATLSADPSRDVIDQIGDAAFGVAFAGFPAVGWMIVYRRPRNRIGWVVMLIGATLYNAIGVMELADRGFRTGALGSGLLWLVSAWNALLPALVIGLFAWFMILFPDGQPDRRGRQLGRATVVTGLIVTLSRLLRPGRLDLSEDVDVANAFGIEALRWLDAVVALSTLGLTVIAVTAFVRLVRRYRRSDAVARKQFQWIVAPLGAFGLLFATGVLLSETTWVTAQTSQSIIISGFVVGFLGLATGIGVAVLRYRLFELDRLVSRTASYGLTVAVLVGLYAASVLGMGAVARAVTGERGSGVVAASTLLVAAAFRPVLRRVRDQVDRRFSRARYDAQREVSLLADRLRREVELDGVVDELAATVDRVVRPSSVSLVLLAGADR